MRTSTPDIDRMQREGKISPTFAARLARLKPAQKLRVVLVLQRPATDSPETRKRVSREERQSAIGKARDESNHALESIDEILRRYDGRRLSKKPTVLGTVAVESTSDGLSALADSHDVKAILEDQPIAPTLSV